MPADVLYCPAAHGEHAGVPIAAFSALTLPVEPALQVQAVSTELANREVEFVGHAEHLET